jgi:ferredoxin-NADP reductase
VTEPSPPRSTVLRVGPWQQSTVVGIRSETPKAKTFRLRLDESMAYLPGQHVVLRLTAPDGYTASRSYSVASAPDGSPEIELTVERLDDGEVSGFLHDEVTLGDQLEVRGPIGQWFVWRGEMPALLLGGGSGVVPLMSMLRFARQRGQSDLLHLVASVRTPGDLYFATELPGPETTVIYTRRTPDGWPRRAGRITAEDLPCSMLTAPRIYVCGSTGFADAVTSVLEDRGVSPDRVRVERFGATG